MTLPDQTWIKAAIQNAQKEPAELLLEVMSIIDQTEKQVQKLKGQGDMSYIERATRDIRAEGYERITKIELS